LPLKGEADRPKILLRRRSADTDLPGQDAATFGALPQTAADIDNPKERT